MLRWTFRILTLLSLLLMIASCIAWVRSASRYEGFVKRTRREVVGIGYTQGVYTAGGFYEQAIVKLDAG